MEYVTITKNGRFRKMLRRVWEDNMPVGKDGWEIVPSKPKEIDQPKKLVIEPKVSTPPSNSGGLKRGPKPKDK